MTLSVNQLSKSFGEKSVLRGVSFQVMAGSALGLLGRNGAGKTTTIRIIMQVFLPDEGSVLLDGAPMNRHRTRIGYLPEEKGLYPKLKIAEQLRYLGELRGLSAAEAAHSTTRWLDRVELADTADKKLETLSKGNQQKIQLAAALLGDPDLLILDEPFGGLDPINARLLEDIVREQVQAGKLVLFSSHQMSYVEQFCDHIALLHDGRIVLSGALREIKRSYPRNRLRIAAAMADTAAADYLHNRIRQLSEKFALTATIDRIDADRSSLILTLRDTSARPAWLSALAASGLDIEQFQVLEPSLEDIFIEKAGLQDETEIVSDRLSV